MHGVDGEQNAAEAVALGHQAAPAPNIDVDPFHRDVAPERVAQIARAVGRLRGHVIAGLVHHQPPDAAGRIDDAQVAPNAAAIDHDEKCAGLAAALPQQIRRAKKHIERIAQRALAGERDAEAAADEACGAVAADQIVGAQRLTLVMRQVRNLGGDAVARLREGLQPVPVLDREAGKRAGQFQQQRIEPDLRAGLQPVRARRLRRLVVARWAHHAAELVTEQAGDEHRVERMIAGKRTIHHRVGDAQRRQNSIVRVFTSFIFGVTIEPSPCSMRVQATPRQPSSAASAKPTGPPPTIRTGVWPCMRLDRRRPRGD